MMAARAPTEPPPNTAAVLPDYRLSDPKCVIPLMTACVLRSRYPHSLRALLCVILASARQQDIPVWGDETNTGNRKSFRQDPDTVDSVTTYVRSVTSTTARTHVVLSNCGALCPTIATTSNVTALCQPRKGPDNQTCNCAKFSPA